MKKSSAKKFMEVIWKGQLQATGHSWTRLNWSLRGAMQNAITAGLRFGPNDFAQIYQEMRGHFWFGTDNNESQGENFYSLAAKWNNLSACRSFEKWKGRRPFIFDDRRLSVGDRFKFGDLHLDVTRMPANGNRPMFACSHDRTRRLAISYSDLRKEDRARAARKKEQKRLKWIEEVYELLCESQGAPENDTEKKNLREWAESMASGDDCNYFAEGYSPRDAHCEELSAA